MKEESPKLYKPGTKCRVSGQYAVVDFNGAATGESERTVVRREKFPPTPWPDQFYVLVDASARKGD